MQGSYIKTLFETLKYLSQSTVSFFSIVYLSMEQIARHKLT